MIFKFHCPNPECNQRISADTEFAGTDGTCPACARSFVVPSPEAAPAPPPASEDDGRCMELGAHAKAVGCLAIILIILGVFTLIVSATGKLVPGEFGNVIAHNRFFSGLMRFGGILYLIYGLFGVVAAGRRKVTTSGFAGFFFFGISTVKAPKHVTIHLIGMLILGSVFGWLAPIALWRM
jgi:hypothetical protein